MNHKTSHSVGDTDEAATPEEHDRVAAEARAKDPVCGMEVDTASAISALHEGTNYHFCSDSCRDKFRANPDGFVKNSPDGQEGVAAQGVEYTCPMHPEIVRNEPGSCPICGMTLEPRTPSVDDEDDAELRDMRRRFWVSVVLTIPVFVSAM